MKTIIAPTDFSVISLHAVNYAADMAAAINAELVVLRILEMPITTAEDTSIEEANKELASLKHELSDRLQNKLTITGRVMPGGVENELKEICRQYDPFAIVMGTHASGAAAGFFLGSYTVFAINHLEYPVLMVPHKAVFHRIDKLALISDLNAIEAVKANELLSEWLRVFNLHVQIIHLYDHYLLKHSAAATVAEETAAPGVLSGTYPAAKEIAHESIHRFAEENDADLIVMLRDDHGGLGALLHKTRLNAFLLHATVPVLSLHVHHSG